MQEEIVDETDEYVDVHKRYTIMFVFPRANASQQEI